MVFPSHGEHRFSTPKDGYTHAKKVAAHASAIPGNDWKHLAVTFSAGTATLVDDAP